MFCILLLPYASRWFALWCFFQSFSSCLNCSSLTTLRLRRAKRQERTEIGGSVILVEPHFLQCIRNGFIPLSFLIFVRSSVMWRENIMASSHEILLDQYFFNSSSISGYHALRGSCVPTCLFSPFYHKNRIRRLHLCTNNHWISSSHQTNHTTRTVLNPRTIFSSRRIVLLLLIGSELLSYLYLISS